MFNPIEIPFGCTMLFNVIDLKEGVTIDDIELMLGEMCNVVKNNYGNDEGGFIGGQVFRNAGFISEEGSIQNNGGEQKGAKQNMGDVVIITYWQSFEQHEKSHADALFKEKFSQLAEFCDETYEVGYEMLWQGVPEK